MGFVVSLFILGGGYFSSTVRFLLCGVGFLLPLLLLLVSSGLPWPTSILLCDCSGGRVLQSL